MTIPSLKVLKHFEMLQRLIEQGDSIESFSKNIVDENSISRLNGSSMLHVKLDNDNHVYLYSIGLVYYNQNSISENHRLVKEVIDRGSKVRDILKIDDECLGCSKIEINIDVSFDCKMIPKNQIRETTFEMIKHRKRKYSDSFDLKFI